MSDRKLCRECKHGNPAKVQREQGGVLGFGAKRVVLERWEPTLAWLPVEGFTPPTIHPTCANPAVAHPVNGSRPTCEAARLRGACGDAGSLWEPRA